MAFTTTRFTIFPAAIKTHFEPGGAVFDNATKLGVESVALAKELAPKRTGLLAASVQRFGRGAASAYGYTVTIAASAPYAVYVLEGTTSPITPWHSPYLTLPAGNGYPKLSRQYVRGQAAQPFLSDAVSTILRQMGYGGLGI